MAFRFPFRRIRDPDVWRNLDALEQYLQKLGITDMAFGVVTVTFTAATQSAIETVNHGMSTTPPVVTVGNAFDPGVVSVVGYVDAGSSTDTTFDCYGAIPGGAAFTGTIDLPWTAFA